MAHATAHEVLERLGIAGDPRVTAPNADALVSVDPSTGEPIAGILLDDEAACERAIRASVDAFEAWRLVPAPKRGEVVRAIGDELRLHKADLGELISLEVGKIRAEGAGEVQEVIDIADFAVGLSRQLHGLTIASERANHSMREQWLPLGPVAVITAFNFPCAVWGWNAMLAAVCGDSVLWKPSLLAPLTAIATNAICAGVVERMDMPAIFGLTIGRDEVVGERIIADRRFPLVSATGSCRMGRRVGSVVGGRLGRTLLELGGNNAAIVAADADLDQTVRHLLFNAVGTAGQRCTTTRRLIAHEAIADQLLERLTRAYRSVRIGPALGEQTLMGPLIHAEAVEAYERAISTAIEQGGELVTGGRARPELGGHFVEPAIIRVPRGRELAIAREETFAPILYAFTYGDLDEAISMNNAVDQGLSSAIFTESIRSAERFLAPNGTGSDCGIANVNLGTSGAEIGGAFGGEKDTGGGRESGSDSWKAYMRRQTCTINHGSSFELAQGIRFE